MKKALAMALGAMLCVGSAAPASAASQIDFSGYYRAYFVNEINRNKQTKDLGTNDSYFINRLNLDINFQATDEIAVYWRLRAPSGERWGDDATNNYNTTANTNHVYGQVTQDWGTIQIGRLAEAHSYFGLDTLGWTPGGVNNHFTNWGVFDYDQNWDGIRYVNRWDSGFQLVAQFNRLGSVEPLTRGNDEQTSDLFILQPSFHWDTGGASLAFIYARDHVTAGLPSLERMGDFADLTAAERAILADLVDDVWTPFTATLPAMKAFYLNPAFAQSFGDFSVHFEGKFGWGKINATKWLTNEGEALKNNGSAFYLDGDYNYGPGNVMLAGWWASGTKEGKDKGNSLVSLDGGADAFVPFLVAYGDQAGFGRNGRAINAIAEANNLNFANIADTTLFGTGTANHWALAINGGHSFTDNVALNYTVGYMALNEVREGAKKDIGWEADLGLNINLLDNLEFRTTFGYLFTGKALDNPTPGAEKAKDAYTWANTLTFSF